MDEIEFDGRETMAVTGGRERNRRTSIRIKESRPPVEICELFALCPKCKSLEALLFADGRLIKTRKFRQRYEKVYHDCGAKEPCRLYRFS
jgi:hypothetical protein